MKTFATIANNGSVLQWQAAGIDVLSPENTIAIESRGGLPLCVPMFSTQQRPVPGCNLPLHGVLMYEAREQQSTIAPGETWRRTHTFTANDTFAWDWSVELSVELTDDGLLHKLTVQRSVDCKNTNAMPLSLGFHPYFNTFGKDFSFTIGDTAYTKSSLPANIIDSDFAPLKNGEAAVLRTAAHTLTITPQGYDEYCLWSDNLDAYFCIEPIYQYREFGLPGTGLEPGQSHTCSVKLQLLTV